MCVPVDLGVLVTEARRQKTLPNHMAGRLLALNQLESLEFALHGSGFIQASLQGGQRVTGISWRYIVRIRLVSQKPLECFGMFFLALQPVFIVLQGQLFCNLS